MKKVLIIIVIFILIGTSYLFYTNNSNKKKEIEETNKISEIKEKYNEYVSTNKDSNLYDLNLNKIGSISKDVYLELESIKDEFFKIKGMDYYIYYEDINKEAKKELNNRHKYYIVWNENVITNDITKFYDEEDNLVFELNKSFDLPIIIKDKDRYGVEYNNVLYYVKDIKEVKKSNNTDVKTRDNIRTLTYHTVYDPKIEKCTSIEICHPISQFEEQMKYLHDNNYLTLTLEEVEMFLDKKIRIPLKTIALTLDDGIFLHNSIPLVEKYKVYATFFIITSRTDVTKYMDSPYARFESHSDNLHNNYKCPLNGPSSQGGQMLCEKKENIVKDLKLSQDKLNGSYYFAYPFFDFNDNAKAALKEAGFKMAFIGQWGTNGYSTYNTDRFMVRRKTVFGNLKLNGFIDYLK